MTNISDKTRVETRYIALSRWRRRH